MLLRKWLIYTVLTEFACCYWSCWWFVVSVKVKIVILIWFGEGICRVISLEVSISAEAFFFFLIKYIPCEYALILRDEKQKKIVWPFTVESINIYNFFFQWCLLDVKRIKIIVILNTYNMWPFWPMGRCNCSFLVKTLPHCL